MDLNSLVIIFCLFLSQLQFGIGKVSNHPIVLVVSFDGFRALYFNQTKTPNLWAIRTSGVSVPYMEPVFPTKTFPNHQSIATGLYAESHGIVDNKVWEPNQRKTLGVGDPGFWTYSPDVMPLWIRNELAGGGRTSGCMMWPGSDKAYGKNNNLLPTHYFKGYDSSFGWRDRVNKVISWIDHPTKPANLVYLYYSQPDGKGHAYGPNYGNILDEVKSVDERAGYLVSKLKEAGLFDKVNLIVLSDHGMKEISRKRVLDMTKVIDSSLVERRHGETPVIQLQAKNGKGAELYSTLQANSLRLKEFKVYKKSELRGSPWNYANSRRILDYVVVAEAGWSFDDIYGRMASYDKNYPLPGVKPENREYGTHGYANYFRSMRAFFFAKGPAFKKGWKGQNIIKNVDVVPLISKLVGLEGVPHNGSWDRVKDMVNTRF